MYKYFLIILPLIVVSMLLFIHAEAKLKHSMIITASIGVLLTIIFDSIIIWAGIVDYNYQNTLGLKLINAPIEDFSYIILSSVLGVLLWHKIHD